MSTSTPTLTGAPALPAEGSRDGARSRWHRHQAIWLLACCALVFAMDRDYQRLLFHVRITDGRGATQPAYFWMPNQ